MSAFVRRKVRVGGDKFDYNWRDDAH
jgi:hypothetical protein